jgi:hypothetical protein
MRNGTKATADVIDSMLYVLNEYMNELKDENPLTDDQQEIKFRHEQIGNYLTNFAVLGVPLHKKLDGDTVEYYVVNADIQDILIPEYCVVKLKELNVTHEKHYRARNPEAIIKYDSQMVSLKQFLETHGEPVTFNKIKRMYRFDNEYYFVNYV